MPTPTTPPFLLLVLTASVLLSCSGKNKDEEKVIELMRNSLESSNATIHISTQVLLKDLENKTTDYCSKERAEVWFPKAETAAGKTTKLYDLIGSVKSKKEIQDSDYTLITNEIIQYKHDILAIDPELPEIFGKNFQFTNTFTRLMGADTLQKGGSFEKIDAASFLSLLAALQNEIRKIENKVVGFCNMKVTCHIGFFDSYSAIIGQNSNSLAPGSELEITAGVGAFSRSAQPNISINNKQVQPGEGGYATYKTRVSKKPGTYAVPLRIKYFDQLTGKNREINTNVNYTVVEPCDQ